MMVSAEQLKSRIEKRWPGAEVIEGDVVRFTKRAKDHDYAVYYLDVGKDLPGDRDELADFQERIIGARYFEGNKSLQWNTYLFFIRDEAALRDPKTLAIKGLLESDRAYARKRLVPVSRLEAIIEPPVVEVSDAQPDVGLLAVWLPLLEGAGIRDAVLGDERIPERMKRIERATSKPVLAVPNKANIKPAEGLRSLKLTTYRPFPLKREYRFGKVNLFFGPNGSGKTSLLEAIELFYCGRSHRNPKSTSPYDFRAVLTSGKEERAASDRPLQVLRDRNLDWYGQPEVNTTNLYQSFAQFNFLNTDAAVRLATTAQDIEVDLAKLLVGPDVSRVWDNIRKLLEETSKELKGLREISKQTSEELKSIEGILQSKAADDQLATVLLQQFCAQIASKGWVHMTFEDRASIANGAGAFGQIEAAIKRALDIEGLPAPLTIDSMRESLAEKRQRLQQTSPVIVGLRDLPNKLIECRARVDRAESLKGILESYLLHLELGTRRINFELKTCQQRHEELKGLLAGMDQVDFQSLPLSRSISDWFEETVYQVAETEASLDEAKRQVMQFQAVLTQSQDLGHRLREFALQSIARSADPDECPVCHTKFGPGELIAHMQVGIDEQLEASIRSSQDVVSGYESELAKRYLLKEQAFIVLRFAGRLGFDAKQVGLERIASTVTLLLSEMRAVQSREEELAGLSADLRRRGLTEEDFLAKEGRLSLEGFDLENVASGGASTRIEQLSAEAQAAITEAGMISARLEDGCRQLASLLGVQSSELIELEDANAKLVEWTVSVDAAISRLVNLGQFVSLSTSRPLSELAEEVAVLRAEAVSVEQAMGREVEASEQRKQALQRKKNVEERLASANKRIAAFQNAQSVFKLIVEEHSLTGAVNLALDRNRRAIESIFSQIHAPDEFLGIGSQLGRLVRRLDKSEVSLNEISTGQRAAYALSIFLAQNAQLRDGPPVLLIDDPVAHVDDLNFLSLLDYLREVAIRGDRQIFFATASDKIASLFERKFDFMSGEDGFKRFDVKRTFGKDGSIDGTAMPEVLL